MSKEYYEYFPSLTDVVAYIYQADIYHPSCALGSVRANHLDAPRTTDATSIENELDELAKWAGIDRTREQTYDSNDFPKVVFRSELEGTEYCGTCRQEID